MPIAAGIELSPNLGVMANVEPAIMGSENLRLRGFSSNPNQGAAELQIIHGPSVSAGIEVINVDLPPNGKDERFYPSGIPFPNGVTIEHVMGIPDIVLYYSVS